METFSCGCPAGDLTGFGRGQARVTRIQNHLNRKCEACAAIHFAALWETLDKPTRGDKGEFVTRKMKKRVSYFL
jgi:hypothetical protein